jgi:uncharacterized membrane protein
MRWRSFVFRLIAFLLFLFTRLEAFQPYGTSLRLNARALPTHLSSSSERRGILFRSTTNDRVEPCRVMQESQVRPSIQDEVPHQHGFVGKGLTLLRRRVLLPLVRSVQKSIAGLRLKRVTLTVALWMMMMLSPAFAVTGGRVGGGGFHSSSSSGAPRIRSAPSRGSSTVMHRSSYHHRPPSYIHRPQVRYIPTSPTVIPIFVPSQRILVDSSSSSSGVVAVSPRTDHFSVSDVALLVGTGAVLAYGLGNSLKDNENDTKNKKIYVGSLTVTFSVPNRRHEFSVLARIERIATTANTDHGVKELVSDVCIELMRNLDRMECASIESNMCTSMNAAEQMYQQKSVLMQSKFDGFVINKFGATNKSPSAKNDQDADSRPTLGLVTIQYATTDESLLLQGKNKLLTRDDLRTALSELASCNPNAAEVIWAPGRSDEMLDAETVYSLFPQLVPI